ncbi:hypothetical protein ALC62_05101 [Cyphomyrmex costatus]|uniref:Uncharacterized protein n=1 Tax=Cyphomyrmex costatus TaxID=456900 RepID=A0A195CUK2_9HYME|nr:hypothetical protein ALC62_05101 [Cyphomyrmex costatus]
MRSTLKIEDDLFSRMCCHCRVGLTALTQALHWEEKFLAGRRLNCCELPDTVGVDARCILRRARMTTHTVAQHDRFGNPPDEYISTLESRYPERFPPYLMDPLNISYSHFNPHVFYMCRYI